MAVSAFPGNGAGYPGVTPETASAMAYYCGEGVMRTVFAVRRLA